MNQLQASATQLSSQTQQQASLNMQTPLLPFAQSLAATSLAPTSSTFSQQQQQQLTFTKKSHEAMPILRRERHLFKVVTIYVVDKYNFNLQKLQRVKEAIAQRDGIQVKGETTEEERKIQTQKDEEQSSSMFVQEHTLDNQIIDEYQPNHTSQQETTTSANRINLMEHQASSHAHPSVSKLIRGQSAPIKGMHPTHFKHGERTHKHCLVCEGYVKAQQKNANSNHGQGSSQLPMTSQGGGGPAGAIFGKDGKSVIDDQASERKLSLKREESGKLDQSQQQQEFGYGGTYSTKPTHSIYDASSNTGNSPRNKMIEKSPESKKDVMDQQQKNSAISKKEDYMHVQGDQKDQDKQHPDSKHAPANPSSPTKRDGDIEEFQRRRILLDDFLQGPPSLKLMFSKHVRKFNRELLKATCLVIGCKRMYANKISELLFDEFDLILNNLSDCMDFEQHFDLEREDDASVEGKDSAKYITTITVSAPLFKYVLKKYLVEKFKYSRPEYLKDFYVASDLVQSKRNILILLAGTSGTGKSTLASLLGSRMGISTVLSTDTIRHVMRNFVAKEDDPIIFASTYETANFVSEEIKSQKKRTLMGYKDQCYKVQTELEKVIDDFQRRNESLVVEGVHLTVRFMLTMMKKYPSCIPFIICITNEDKHKERFAVRTKHMTIDPRFNKYIKNVGSIRTIQKHLIKKAEAALIPRIDNSNIDKSIGLIHATIVRCLRQIAEGTPIFDAQRKQAMIMHQEFANISKNKLSSKDAQKFIHQKVNKGEILELYMKQQANTELEEKLKRYKRGQSMGQMNNGKSKKQTEKKSEPISLGLDTQAPLSSLSSPDNISPVVIQMMNSMQSSNNEIYRDDESPRAKTIHVIMRPDGDSAKISEQEKKNIKKQFLNVFQDFPEDEETFGDSKASLLVAASGVNKQSNSKPKIKKDKKDKPQDIEESRIRDEKKRQSDQQKKIEEEKILSAMLEAQKKEKEEQEKVDAESRIEKERLEQEKVEHDQQQQDEQEEERMHNLIDRIQQQLAQAPKSQSLIIHPFSQTPQEVHEDTQRNHNKSFEYLAQEEDEDYETPIARRPSTVLDEEKSPKSGSQQLSNSPQMQAPINITNVKERMKKEQHPVVMTFVEDLEPEMINNLNQTQVESNAYLSAQNQLNQAEVRSMSSFEHLKELENLKELSNSQRQDSPSDNGDDDILRDANVSSSGIIPEYPRKELIHNDVEQPQLYASEYNANEKINPSKGLIQYQSSKFKKPRDKEDVKSVEPPIQVYHHPGLILKSMNKSTERQGGQDGSSEGNSNENKSSQDKIKGLTAIQGGAEKKLQSKYGFASLKGLKYVEKGLSSSKIRITKLKTQGSVQLTKRIHKKSAVVTQPLGQALVQGPGQKSPATLQSEQIASQYSATQAQLQKQRDQNALDETQSVYSGSGLAPSLVSASINFFPQGNAGKTDDDNHSAAMAGEQLHESGESSDDMNSQDAEASDRGAISEEEDVVYSQSSDSDHEEEHEDEIDKKQTSFNQQKIAATSQTVAQTQPSGGLSPPKGNENPIPAAVFDLLSGDVAESDAQASEAYDYFNPVSKKSFEDDSASQHVQKSTSSQHGLE